MTVFLFELCFFCISFSFEEVVIAKCLGRCRMNFKAFLKEH